MSEKLVKVKIIFRSGPETTVEMSKESFNHLSDQTNQKGGDAYFRRNSVLIAVEDVVFLQILSD